MPVSGLLGLLKICGAHIRLTYIHIINLFKIKLPCCILIALNFILATLVGGKDVYASSLSLSLCGGGGGMCCLLSYF